VLGWLGRLRPCLLSRGRYLRELEGIILYLGIFSIDCLGRVRKRSTSTKSSNLASFSELSLFKGAQNVRASFPFLGHDNDRRTPLVRAIFPKLLLSQIKRTEHLEPWILIFPCSMACSVSPSTNSGGAVAKPSLCSIPAAASACRHT
jgi:hypothetical protein